jgi:hypothetical protein
MGVTSGRASQIEHGELATIDAAARYVEALGGRFDSSPASVAAPHRGHH